MQHALVSELLILFVTFNEGSVKVTTKVFHFCDKKERNIGSRPWSSVYDTTAIIDCERRRNAVFNSVNSVVHSFWSSRCNLQVLCISLRLSRPYMSTTTYKQALDVNHTSRVYVSNKEINGKWDK